MLFSSLQIQRYNSRNVHIKKALFARQKEGICVNISVDIHVITVLFLNVSF